MSISINRYNVTCHQMHRQPYQPIEKIYVILLVQYDPCIKSKPLNIICSHEIS